MKKKKKTKTAKLLKRSLSWHGGCVLAGEAQQYAMSATKLVHQMYYTPHVSLETTLSFAM